MTKVRLPWILAGLVSGLSGLATSYLVAAVMNLRLSPIPAIAELIIRITPGGVAAGAEQSVGTNDKPLLLVGIGIFLLVVFALIGEGARRWWWVPTAAYGVLAVVGAVGYLSAPGGKATDLAPIVVGYVTWMITVSVLAERLRRLALLDQVEAGASEVGHGRRVFLGAAGAFTVAAIAAGSLGRLAGGARRAAVQARSLLRLPITQPVVPAGTSVDVAGVGPWMTPNDDFYLIDTAIIKPSIQPKHWSLRIHGMVEKEIVLTFDDLVRRQISEDWVTLICVSNPVGGPYVGNAWWSGVRLDSLLAEAGLLPGADAVLQTSDDGWSCGTPLEAMTDGRNAMLAVAMNGKPLPIEHGFPVRTVVPGLYGYVSACKWVVDMEVTRFDQISAYWTERGWGELGPVKMQSKIEAPRSGDRVEAGDVAIGGVAWAQNIGIKAVEVALDGGAWQSATLARVPGNDSWVQWKAVVQAAGGDHQVRVRATDNNGLVQTGARAGVLPDGATGWDQIGFTATGTAT